MNGGRESSLERIGRALVERRGGHWGAGGGLCLCPAHDDRTPSLSVRPGRSRLLFHCFAGCGSEEVARALRLDGHLDAAPGPDRAEPVRRSDAGAAARRIWQAATPIDGTPAQAYLRGRGLEVASRELRFCRRTPDGPWPQTRLRPALIAAVRDEAGLVAVQRTFLRAGRGGAPPLRLRRAALGRLGTGAVRLGRTAARIGLAEGIETALSATALFGLPCWAVLGAARLHRIALPDLVEEVRLYLDNDAAGRRAEALARQAFAPRKVLAVYPPRTGADWNDMLRFP